ncbi:hypothetical protein L6261_02435 [Candidatus Parcubacteria bacterium]|nr:hypothetical protein [Candidatus Parcubacteria bacterium]
MIKHKSKITNIFKKLCEKNNYTFVINGPDEGYFIDGRRRKHYFGYGTIGLNELRSSEIADSKDKSSALIRKSGVEVPREIIIKNIFKHSFNRLLNKTIKFVDEVHLPIILKPLKGRQGNNVFKVESVKQLSFILEKFIKNNEDLILQEYIDFNEIRVVTLEGEVIQAYERFRPYVISDGISSVSDLIKRKNDNFSLRKRNTIIRKSDSQIKTILANKGYSDKSILEKGKKIFLSYGRNLSKGGEYKFVESKINDDFRGILKELSLLTGLKLVGFDLFIKKSVSLIKNKEDIVFIEYNASPDMENNFYYNDQYSERILEIYTKIFEKIINKK